YLHDFSDYFRREQSPGGTLTHWKAPPYHGAHPLRTFAALASGRSRATFGNRRGGPPPDCAPAGSAPPRPRTGAAPHAVTRRHGAGSGGVASAPRGPTGASAVRCRSRFP